MVAMSELENDDESGGQSESEWKFTLEDIEQREAEKQAEKHRLEKQAKPLTPDQPTIEGTIFVVLGIFVALYILSRFFVV